jgi:GABA(A) receptor-associated protein
MEKSIKGILTRNPNRVALICLPGTKSKLKGLDKNKFLVPRDLTVSQFIFVLRSRMDKNDDIIKNKEAIYIYYRDRNGKINIPSHSTLFGFLYDNNMEENKCLYIYYDKENVFG